MRKIGGLILVTCLCWVSDGNTRGLDKSATDVAFRACDFNNDANLAPGQELDCFKDALANALDGTASAQRAQATRQTVPAAATTSSPSASDSRKASSNPQYFLRRSMDAISSFADPTSHEDAAGAEFAWADDGITDNTVWSARGIAAMAFTHNGKVQRDDPYIQSIVVAPYVAFDRSSNSRIEADDIDNLTYGGLIEGAWSNIFLATHYFRASGSLVTSFAGEEKNWAITGEWQPVGAHNPYGRNTIFSYFGGPLPRKRSAPFLGFTLSPKLVAEYRSELGDVASQPLFSTDPEAFRTGPVVVFTIDGLQQAHVPWWLRRVHYEVTYGWLYDWISGRDYGLLDTSLTISLDELQHVGLSFGYRKGELVETGQDVDRASVALSFSY